MLFLVAMHSHGIACHFENLEVGHRSETGRLDLSGESAVEKERRDLHGFWRYSGALSWQYVSIIKQPSKHAQYARVL